MLKILFFDYRELETVEGFTRCLGRPEKADLNPLFVADQPWENGNMQLYGSVVRAPDGRFQLWYSVIHDAWRIYLAYAESDDGFDWHKPELDLFLHEGRRTNILLDIDIHGPAVVLDPREPDPAWRYKMVAGAEPAHCVYAFGSPDGIAWNRLGRFPVINTNPDCPMGFFRARDGRFVAFHRVHGYGRRPFRSESWDLRHWSGEPRMVLEPGPEDDAQTQFYGFGAAPYGDYEIGSLWIYHTELDDAGTGKMCGYQEAELTYARSGYAVHRAMPGTPFIPHGTAETWDRGNLQCASQPVFLPGEIRYYYMGTTMRHKSHWELDQQTAGLGVARLEPDRFVGLTAEREEAELVTMAFAPLSPRFFVNAAVGRGGWVKAELLSADGQALAGFSTAECRPVTGDSVAHAIEWTGAGTGIAPDARVRVRLVASDARVYSIFNVAADETPVYHEFRSVLP